MALVVWLPTGSASAQTVPVASYRVNWWDAASISAAVALHLTPSALGLQEGPPSCVPCDPATLSGIDRWAVHPVSKSADVGSDVALLAVLGGTALAGLGSQPAEQWRGNLVVFANTAAWTQAISEWLKVGVRRERPVMYTDEAAAAASVRSSQMSMPSGHAALAFAAATSYFVISGRQHLPHRTRNAILFYAGAVSVASLRVFAGKHFPTDVLAGAVLGSGIGWLVPTIHP